MYAPGDIVAQHYAEVFVRLYLFDGNVSDSIRGGWGGVATVVKIRELRFIRVKCH